MVTKQVLYDSQWLTHTWLKEICEHHRGVTLSSSLFRWFELALFDVLWWKITFLVLLRNFCEYDFDFWECSVHSIFIVQLLFVQFYVLFIACCVNKMILKFGWLLWAKCQAWKIGAWLHMSFTAWKCFLCVSVVRWQHEDNSWGWSLRVVFWRLFDSWTKNSHWLTQVIQKQFSHVRRPTDPVDSSSCNYFQSGHCGVEREQSHKCWNFWQELGVMSGTSKNRVRVGFGGIRDREGDVMTRDVVGCRLNPSNLPVCFHFQKRKLRKRCKSAQSWCYTLFWHAKHHHTNNPLTLPTQKVALWPVHPKTKSPHLLATALAWTDLQVWNTKMIVSKSTGTLSCWFTTSQKTFQTSAKM